MSFRVDRSLIDLFRADRTLLPYDDGMIAARMGINRSNYSKAVNNGPITNAFLKKFYTSFLDELLIIKDKLKAAPSNSEKIRKGSSLDCLKELLDQMEGLVADQENLSVKIESLEKAVDRTLDKIGRIESLVNELAIRIAPAIV